MFDLSGGQKLKVEVLQGVLDALEQWGSSSAPVGSSAGDASAEVGGADQDEETDEASFQLSAFTLPGLPLLASVPLQQSSDGASAAGSDQTGGQAAAADERNRQHLLVAVGAVLKRAVNASCCTPEVRDALPS